MFQALAACTARRAATSVCYSAFVLQHKRPVLPILVMLKKAKSAPDMQDGSLHASSTMLAMQQ